MLTDILCDDILDVICKKCKIQCHTCQRNFHFNFFLKQKKFYYCSEICYYHI